MLPRPLATAVLGILLLPAAVMAQTTVSMLDRYLVGASAQVQLPLFDGDLNAVLLDLGGRVPLGTHTNLIFELPLLRASGDDGLGTSISTTAIGNPYVGLRLFREHAIVDLGIRLPLLDVDNLEDLLAVAAGATADFDRVETWLHDFVPLRASLTRFLGRPRLADGLSTRIIIGPTIMIGQAGNDTELLVNYGLALSHATPTREVQAALTGAMNATEDGDFGERSAHHVSFGLTFRTTGVRPTIFTRIPIDDPPAALVNLVLGMGIVADLR